MLIIEPPPQLTNQSFTAQQKEFCEQWPKFSGVIGEDVLTFIKRVNQAMQNLRLMGSDRKNQTAKQQSVCSILHNNTQARQEKMNAVIATNLQKITQPREGLASFYKDPSSGTALQEISFWLNLELALLRIQEKRESSEVALTLNVLKHGKRKTASESGIKPKVANFGDKAEDTVFLNALQNQVSKWIRQIQKVTKLDRDPSSTSALQEISFWLNLERALLRIQEKR